MGASQVPFQEPELDFDAQLEEESKLLLEAASTVQLVLQTGAFRALPHALWLKYVEILDGSTKSLRCMWQRSS